MSIQPSTEVPIPVLKCMYPDCGNEWIPRTTRMPKVCPRCKKYNWDRGITRKRKGGKKHVAKVVKSTNLGPETKRFLELHEQSQAQPAQPNSK